MLASITPRSAYGRATGGERAGDNAGAIVGPLLAAGLVGVVGIRHAILLAIIPGLFAAHNAFATIASIIGGQLIDRLSPRAVFGAAVYVVSYATFAVNQHAWPVLLVAFGLAGIGIGLAETAETTTVALMLPDRLRGNGFGVLGLVQSFGDLGSTVVAGVLWTVFSPTIAFSYVAVWMLASVLAVVVVRPQNPVPSSAS